MKSFLKYATDKVCVSRALKVALVVGSINGLITQYDAIFSGAFAFTNMFQIALTYIVPFGVSTFSSAMQAKYDELEGKLNKQVSKDA
jgi:thiamine transporter ThiT